MLHRLERILESIFLSILLMLLLTADTTRMVTRLDQARAFTRPFEFNYDAWTLDAAWVKIQQGARGMPYRLERGEQLEAVMESLRLTESILRAENRLSLIYADPDIPDKRLATAHLRSELDKMNSRQDELAPLAESVVQAQVADILVENGLTLWGQPTPPVLYHVTPLPMNLVISPRDHIEQEYAISLEPSTTLEDQVLIENGVAHSLDVSTLVVPVGGIGVYPTMVMRTEYFSWQVGTVIHEWVHNFLSLRPLGMSYGSSAEVRTMNETTASIVENEIAPLLLARYYPTLTSSISLKEMTAWNPFNLLPEDPPPFDFRAEMHTTRVRADELLAEGKITEAEAYMERRRLVFWDNGYAIRKLNQAYFAFYGAYADIPGGPAGEDPVGPAVRRLRDQSRSLADFLYTIAWMNSYDDLLKAIGEPAQP